MLYCVMAKRTQLYLDEDQYRWLKRQAGPKGSIAGVVRDLIDRARGPKKDLRDDPAIRFLLDEPPERGRVPGSADTIDEELYGR